jgi:hypothetical protein
VSSFFQQVPIWDQFNAQQSLILQAALDLSRRGGRCDFEDLAIKVAGSIELASAWPLYNGKSETGQTLAKKIENAFRYRGWSRKLEEEGSSKQEALKKLSIPEDELDLRAFYEGSFLGERPEDYPTLDFTVLQPEQNLIVQEKKAQVVQQIQELHDKKQRDQVF